MIISKHHFINSNDYYQILKEWNRRRPEQFWQRSASGQFEHKKARDLRPALTETSADMKNAVCRLRSIARDAKGNAHAAADT
jgi:hypothetical protein